MKGIKVKAQNKFWEYQNQIFIYKNKINKIYKWWLA